MNLFINLLQEIAATLQQLNWQLVTAESCTGGMVASCITDISGSSHWFERGFVTYSNLAKQELLSVPEQSIITYGAVSKEVATAMVLGALQHSIGHVALAVTGIAGPNGGTIEKPVGTVCFAWAIRNAALKVVKKQLSGNRQEIRQTACQYALEGLLTFIRQSS